MELALNLFDHCQIELSQIDNHSFNQVSDITVLLDSKTFSASSGIFNLLQIVSDKNLQLGSQLLMCFIIVTSYIIDIKLKFTDVAQCYYD